MPGMQRETITEVIRKDGIEAVATFDKIPLVREGKQGERKFFVVRNWSVQVEFADRAALGLPGIIRWTSSGRTRGRWSERWAIRDAQGDVLSLADARKAALRGDPDAAPPEWSAANQNAAPSLDTDGLRAELLRLVGNEAYRLMGVLTLS